MAITSKLVQELREKTGVGMMDCKRALEESNGNLEEAVKILRKKGMAVAQKRADKAAKEGKIVSLISEDGKKGVILELNCETDFVAKTDDFKSLMDDICAQIMDTKAKTVDEFVEEPLKGDASQKIKDRILAVIGKLGENIQLRRFVKMEGDYVSTYIHAGGKIGVILEAKVDSVDEKVKELSKELCMQVAAASPKFVSRDVVTKEFIDSEKEIYKAQVIAQGKPENIVDKIVDGKINKYFEEICLVEQGFIKDPTVKVAAHIASSVQVPFSVKGFVKFALGEEIKSEGE
jgi:elongation factor Ts